MSAPDEGDKPTVAGCALCGKPRDPRYQPFCSKRCADIDLGRWLGGRYAIPAHETEDGMEASPIDEETPPRLN